MYNMDFVKPPPPLRTNGEISKNWQGFKQRFELFLTASETSGKPRKEATKTALLLSIAGEEAIEIFNTFEYQQEEDSSDYKTVVQKFDAYFAGQSNEVHERYVFRSRIQKPGEPFEHFVRDLKTQAASCNFGSLKESMIRDQIVYGTTDSNLREKLLRDNNLTLQKAELAGKAAEAAAGHQEVWARELKEVDPVGVAPIDKTFSPGPAFSKCLRCGRKHAPRSCPAFGMKCRKCHRRNHFAICCKTTTEVHELRGSEDNFDILDVSNLGKIPRDWTVRAQIKNLPVNLKVDTGAQANLLPLSCYLKMRPQPPLNPSSAVLRSYGGGAIQHVGVIRTEVTLNDSTSVLDFFIVRKGRQAILGLQACQLMRLVPRVYSVSKSNHECIFDEFRHLFTGTGCVQRAYKMVLRDGAIPVVQAARRVPVALQEPLKMELDRMQRASIITKVTEPTDWVSPVVIVRKKDGKIRVCIDPRNINECLKREHYIMPRREDIEADLAGATVFSRLDANSGFHQIPLDDETSRICTFATPFGRYRFLRLPFGIASASEVFQRTLNEIFEELPGVRVYVDDVLIWGASIEEHNERLKSVLRAAERAGLTFNPEKCTFAVEKIEFLGDVIDKNGIRPSPSLINCMLQIPTPVDKLAVQRMLGVANYFSKFLPSLAERTTLLRGLIKKDRIFEWTDNHNQEWKQLCDSLSKEPLLSIFDPQRKTKVSCDASRNGVGSALLQYHNNAWKPVAYASRALSETEQRYSQIEKETLALLYGCERFHHFIYGRNVIAETDHRPLITIARKPIGDMPPRLQRFFLRLLRYDLDLQFIPGKQLVLADMLSRATSRQAGDTDSDDVEVHAVSVMSSLVSDRTWKWLSAETEKDEELKDVLKNLESGEDIKGQWRPFQAELSQVNGVLLKGCKVVIPASMRREMLDRIHQGHLGVNKCKSRARQLVFWPGINQDIESICHKCAPCRKYAYKQPTEPLKMRPAPPQPWYRVGADLFEYGGRTYLCVYDALSNFPEVELLKDTSSRTVIEAASAIFARYGIPVELCTDNGPQFTSHDFAAFSQLYDFKHVTSSPRYPQSNGLAEKGVQVVKRILKKTTDAKQDFWLGLLAYRTTPMEGAPSPAEVLQGRRLRTTLPDVRSVPEFPVRKHRQSNACRRTLAPLGAGDTVRVKGGSWSTKARVLEPCNTPRSYHVVTEEGRVLRRNRQHLLPTGESFRRRTCSSSSEDFAEQTANCSSGPAALHAPNTAGIVTSRSSTRLRRPPQRLTYDRNFVQVS